MRQNERRWEISQLRDKNIFIGERRVEECNREIVATLLSEEDSRGSSKMGLRGKSRQRDGPGVPVLLRGHKFY